LRAKKTIIKRIAIAGASNIRNFRPAKNGGYVFRNIIVLGPANAIVSDTILKKYFRL
jgi:hypothetical protein